jgi:DNA-binding XRE family transcriptional regulator
VGNCYRNGGGANPEGLAHKACPWTAQRVCYTTQAYRLREELTQSALGKKADIPQPHIAAMESGKRPIGLIAAKKLALALGIDYKKLL